MNTASLKQLEIFLLEEAGFSAELSETKTAKSLKNTRSNLLKHLCEVGKSSDLFLIIATEKSIVQGDLDRYANSKGMVSSLRAALSELEAIEHLLALLENRQQYQLIDVAHSLAKNRKAGLPVDEARQAFSSHYVRLSNLDKSRLPDDEKQLIDIRKDNIGNAEHLYIRLQADILGITLN